MGANRRLERHGGQIVYGHTWMQSQGHGRKMAASATRTRQKHLPRFGVNLKVSKQRREERAKEPAIHAYFTPRLVETMSNNSLGTPLPPIKPTLHMLHLCRRYDTMIRPPVHRARTSAPMRCPSPPPTKSKMTKVKNDSPMLLLLWFVQQTHGGRFFQQLFTFCVCIYDGMNLRCQDAKRQIHEYKLRTDKPRRAGARGGVVAPKQQKQRRMSV